MHESVEWPSIHKSIESKFSLSNLLSGNQYLGQMNLSDERRTEPSPMRSKHTIIHEHPAATYSIHL
jgi:hypothetical protein